MMAVGLSSMPGAEMHDDGSPQEPVLAGRNLVKVFRGRAPRGYSLLRAKIRAVNDVSVQIHSGRTVGIAGESGCGKTTLARMMVGALQPDSGEIYFEGRDVAELSREEWKFYRAAVQAVFQDPRSAINPRLTVERSVAEPLSREQNRSKSELTEAVDRLLRAVGLEEGVRENFPHQLSGGMLQRVAIAQALASDPKIIVLDEPVSALDVSIRAQIMNLLQDLRQDFGVSFFMISHDLATMRYLSDDIGVMYLGKLVEYGSADQVFDEPRHPYTVALLSAAPEIQPEGSQKVSSRIVLSGDIPSPEETQQGCSFHTRCPLWLKLDHPSVCLEEDPALQSTSEHHSVACHFWESIPDELAPASWPSAAGSDPCVAAEPVFDPNTVRNEERRVQRADDPW